MNEKNDIQETGSGNEARECVPGDLGDEMKMLEISEAIHDLDAKLTNLEIALKIDGNK